MALMKNLELILPFSIPPVGLEKDLLKAMRTPALATLVASSKRSKIMMVDDFSKALPHEYWLANKVNEGDFSTSPANTWNKMQEHRIAPQVGFWFTLQPVHIHFASDHLVLLDPRRLQLKEEEAQRLFEAAKDICNEFQLELIYGDLTTWFLRADAWAGLKTATPDAACGHNIEIWMAQGEQARAWRKLQNEIQMLWFSHPVNQERELKGLNPINSVWISGGADKLMATSRSSLVNKSLTDLLTLPSDQQNTAAIVDTLTGAALNSDWGYWLEQIHGLENEWFAPLIKALKNKQLEQINLICSDAKQVSQFTITPWSLRQFWIKPSLNKLFTLHT